MRSIGPTFIEQPVKIALDPNYGNQREREWQGRWDYLLNALVIGNLAIGARTAQYTQEGGKATVRAQYGGAAVEGGTEVPTITFSLKTNTHTASIFKNPFFSFINSATVKLILDEKEKLANGSDVDKPGDRQGAFDRIWVSAFAESGDDSVYADTALAAFRLLIFGDENYIVANTYTFTMTRTSSYGFNLPAVFVDDGKLFSSTGLANYTASTLPFTIPPLGPLTSGEQLQLVYAWRKIGSEWTNLPNTNVQLTESWESSRWSKLIYEVSSWG